MNFGDTMKRILLIFACVSLLTLSACEKKQITDNTTPAQTEVTATESATTHTSTTSQSPDVLVTQENVQDIAHDFALIQNLNIEKSAEAQPIAEKLQHAIANGDTATRDATAIELNNKRLEINNTLEQLTLKSAEGDQLRKNSIQLNQLAIEMTNEGFKTPADPEKIKMLMQGASELQSNIQQQVSDIEYKITK